MTYQKSVFFKTNKMHSYVSKDLKFFEKGLNTFDKCNCVENFYVGKTITYCSKTCDRKKEESFSEKKSGSTYFVCSHKSYLRRQEFFF